MNTDRLAKMARAAGFAMACEDTPSAVSNEVRQPQWTARSPVPNVASKNAVVPLRSTRSSFTWGFTSFSFWKTA